MKIIRKNKILLAIVIVLMLSVFSMIPQMAIANEEDCPIDAGENSGEGVVPILYTKCAPYLNHNPTCSDIGVGDNAYTIKPVVDGVHYGPEGLEVTLTVTGLFVNWTSNIPVKVVMVKGGPSANRYNYGTGSIGDTNLHAPVHFGKVRPEYYGLSHIDFCYSECPLPTCNIVCDPVDCTACENGGVTLTENGGDAVSWKWSTGAETQSITVTASGTYSVTITDECGESTCEKKVTIYPEPACNITCSPENCRACENGGVTLTEDGDDAVSWLWSTGGTGSSITVTASGTYSVTITDEFGCQSTCEKKVTIYEEPACNITCSPENCRACENGGVTLTETGGDAVSWSWSTGETGSSITVTASGTYSVTITDEFGCQSTCEKTVTIYPEPACIIASVDPICAGESVQLYAAVNGGTPDYTYSWGDNVGGTFNNSSVEDPIWNSPAGFTGIATLTLTVTDSKGCTTTCFVNVTVDPCEKECKCSLVVQKRDEAGNPIDGAVFVVDGIEKTTSGGEARWDNLECNTKYEVKEISPEKVTRSITLGDCGERSTMRVVNKIEEGELEVLGIMEVLPFTGPAIPYSPFIGISTVLAGTFLYILSKSKKKR